MLSLRLWLTSYFVAFLVLYSHGEVVVRVDSVDGDDDNCQSAIELSNTSNTGQNQTTSCATITTALYGRNQSNNYYTSRNCSSFPYELDNVRVVLAGGEHKLVARLYITKASNIFIVSEQPRQASISCISFPNTVSNYFDNILTCSSSDIKFEGVVFHNCGPVSSNVFVYNTTNVSFNNCVFR